MTVAPPATQPDRGADLTIAARRARATSRVAIFFAAAFAITWVVWIPRAINPGGFFDTEAGEILGMVWSYGPALAAIAAALAIDGRAGLAELGSRLDHWRVGWIWYAVAIGGGLLLAVATGVVNLVLGGTVGEAMSDIFDGGIVTVLLVLAILGLTDGLGEETGWRGYALPRLLEATGAVGASVILGLAWAAWHLPLFWTAGSSLEGSSFVALVIRLPATAIIFTWLYQRTGGSLLLALLFHAALNLFAAAPATTAPQVPFIAAAVHWAIALCLVQPVRAWHARTVAEPMVSGSQPAIR